MALRGPGGGAILATALALGASPPARPQCCPPVAVAETAWPATGGRPSIAADALGDVHAFVHVGDGSLHHAVSRDGGLTFGPPDPTLFEGSTHGQGVTTADGTVTVAYLKDQAAWVRVSSDAGRTFSAPVHAFDVWDIGPFVAFEPHVELQVRPTGMTVLAATTLEANFPDTITQVTVAASADHGRTWGPALQRRFIGTQLVTRGDVAATDSAVVATWVETGEAWVRRGTPAGGWEPPVRVDGGIAVADTSVTTTSGARAQVAFATTDTPIEIHVLVSADDGASWPPPGAAVATADFLVDGRLEILGLPSGRLAVTGFTPEGGGPGLGVQVSDGHGLPGTWLDAPTAFSREGVRMHHVRLAPGPGDAFLAVHDDYRHEADCPPDAIGTCESIYLDRSCGGGRAWLTTEHRLDDDTPPRGAHSEDPEVAASPGGRLHVLWTDGGAPEAFAVRHVALDVPPAPDVQLVDALDPAAGCADPTLVVEVAEHPPAGCADPTYRWYLDDEPVEGVDGPTLVLEAARSEEGRSVRVVVTCGGDAPCGGPSPELVVDVPEPESFDLVVHEVPPSPCLPAHHVLEVPEDTLGRCADPRLAWLKDGAPLAGEAGTSLTVSLATTPPGLHAFSCELTCAAPPWCGLSAGVELEVLADPGTAPGDVGDALRATGHGDPHAATAVGDFAWPGDEGAPRPAGEHFHALRGTDPRALFPLPGLEPLGVARFTDTTPAAAVRPLVHFYRVVAADECERVSAR